MKKLTGYTIAIFMTWFAEGCHASRYAVDDTPSVKIDQRFLGQWKIVDKPEKDLYILSRQDDYHYLLTIKEKKDTHPLSVFLSDVNGVTILNVMVPEDTGYFFFRVFDMNDAGTEAKVAVVDDTSIANLPSAALVRKYFLQRVANPDFYNDTATFRKIGR